MAENVTLVADLTPDVGAATDLRGAQYKAVRFDAGGVRFATTDIGSGPIWVLANKPNSGEACQLVSNGNVTKAVAGGTVIRGNWITCNGSAYWVDAGSDGSPLRVGMAMTAAASGYVFGLHIRY